MPPTGGALRCAALSSTKNALITGASRGIGRAIAIRLAELGYNLFLLARNEELLAQVAATAQKRGVKTGSLAGELTDESYLDAALDLASRTLGPVDVLVNNAGSAMQQPAQAADVGKWRKLMDLNFHAVVSLSQRVLPTMIESKSGAVINISSIMGRSTGAGSGVYCATKHALNAFTECMYEDVRDYGIKVSSIMPGFVSTDLTDGMGMNSRNMIAPNDVADSVQYVLSASASACPTEIVLRPQLRP